MQEGAPSLFSHTRGPLAKRQEAILAETTGLALAILASSDVEVSGQTGGPEGSMPEMPTGKVFCGALDGVRTGVTPQWAVATEDPR